jgi:eukaryotic-like serine/threonine-protein kinase
MTASWSLPGYDVQALLGRGAGGEVWRAIERSTGRSVALRRLPGGSDPQALQLAAVLLRSLDTPYVVQLLDVVDSSEGTVLVLELAEGGSLAGLLLRRRALEPGEVVTIAVPLARALAVAHDRGLVHGAVSPSSVLFARSGMPLLSGLGRPPSQDADADADADIDTGTDAGTYVDPAVAAGGPPSGAGDVWSLAAVCHCLLTGRPPALDPDGRVRLEVAAAPALAEAVATALVLDPALRPDAGAFADALLLAHGAHPVRLDRAPPALPGHGRHAGAVTPGAGRHAAPRGEGMRSRIRRPVRHPPRGLALAAAGAVLLVGAAAVGVAWGQAGSQALPGPAPVLSAPPVDRTPSSPAWADLLDGLDAERAQSFATADAARLKAVYAPGAPGLAADRALVDRLAGAGRVAVGVRHHVRSVEPLEVDGDRVRLRVVDVLAGYEVRDAAGAVAETRPGRAEATHLVDLARTPAGWRLVQVTRV